MSDEANDNAALGRGDFFAVDRRTRSMAFDTASLHAALAYLVMARGSLADMRTTSWSAESVNHRARLNWRQAKEAISKLIAAGLIRQDKGGSKPRYYIMPAHLIRGGAVEAESARRSVSTLVSAKSPPATPARCSVERRGGCAIFWLAEHGAMRAQKHRSPSKPVEMTVTRGT
jgi:hypothetical protein